MTIVVGGIWHETNTFSPLVTDRECFVRYQLLEGAAIRDTFAGTNSELGGMLDAAAELGVPLVRALHCRHGPPQARLSGAKRLDNLAGRIRAKGPTPARVLLVDDVLTTGATAHACITELLGTTSHLVLVATACVARPDS